MLALNVGQGKVSVLSLMIRESVRLWNELVHLRDDMDLKRSNNNKTDELGEGDESERHF